MLELYWSTLFVTYRIPRLETPKISLHIKQSHLTFTSSSNGWTGFKMNSSSPFILNTTSTQFSTPVPQVSPTAGTRSISFDSSPWKRKQESHIIAWKLLKFQAHRLKLRNIKIQAASSHRSIVSTVSRSGCSLCKNSHRCSGSGSNH
jgi:hypothetical protein